MKYLNHLRQQGCEKENATGGLPPKQTIPSSVGSGGEGVGPSGKFEGTQGAHSATQLERRRARVIRQLQENPELRVAVDARDAPLVPEPGEPVSVVIAVRAQASESEVKESRWSGNFGEASAGIVSAEVSIPRERFDFVLFNKMLDETSRRPS